MRNVAHWDGDRFFASIEQAADGRLRGRAVVVGGERRGVVLSASGEARRLGIRPGWPMGRARRAKPDLVVIPAHYEMYEQFFEQLMGLCREVTPLVEASGVGAAWLDLTGAERALGRGPERVVADLRATARAWLRVSLSAGLAGNKVVARIAARLRKPGAQVVVPGGRERVFLAPLPLRWLPGLDGAAAGALEVAGVRTLGEFAGLPTEALTPLLGRRALPLQRLAQGVSEEPVGGKKARGEGFREVVEFEEDQWDTPVLVGALRGMAGRLMARVRAAGVEIRQIGLTVRYTDREENRRTRALAEPTALEGELDGQLGLLLAETWVRRVRLRALTLEGGRVYRPSAQMELFTDEAPKRPAQMALAAAIDGLRKAHGAGIVRRGWELGERGA
ncbi:MAG: hypothetical protein KJZ79_21855 [Bryobacteraceae bacterium]|nr:hypothetical protein [Bryobacteraceae bacterium]